RTAIDGDVRNREGDPGRNLREPLFEEKRRIHGTIIQSLMSHVGFRDFLERTIVFEIVAARIVNEAKFDGIAESLFEIFEKISNRLRKFVRVAEEIEVHSTFSRATEILDDAFLVFLDEVSLAQLFLRNVTPISDHDGMEIV